MIPKIIHYVWFGSKENCNKNNIEGITSIRKFVQEHPDYQLMEWDEVSFDVNTCDFTRQAYAAGSTGYGFIVDYIRWWCLYTYGGIYLDTDMVVYRPFDELLNEKMCFSFHNEKFPCMVAAVMAEKGHPLVKKLMNAYGNMQYANGKTARFHRNSFRYVRDFLEKEGYKIPTTNPKDKIQYDCFSILSEEYFPDNKYVPTSKSIAKHFPTYSWIHHNTSFIIIEDENFIHSITNYLYNNNGSNDLIIVDGPEGKYEKIVKPFLANKKITYWKCHSDNYAEKVLFATKLSSATRYYIFFDNNVWYNKDYPSKQTLSLNDDKEKKYQAYTNTIENSTQLALVIRKSVTNSSILEELTRHKIDNLQQWQQEFLNSGVIKTYVDENPAGKKH